MKSIVRVGNRNVPKPYASLAENRQVTMIGWVNAATSGQEFEVRVQGLEPWTYGLKVRCSTD